MKKIKSDYVVLGGVLLAVIFLVGAFARQWPWVTTGYNSYLLQVKSWLLGRLDLGQNYENLEIAIYQGKYFLSFPPFPSYIMTPLYMIFGDAFKGGVLAYASLAIAMVYCYKIYSHFRNEGAVFFALFSTICSNYLFIAVNDWVWFIAQNLCFTLTAMAIYYAIKGKGYPCFIFWACAVGCRPFTMLYLPFLIMLCYENTPITKNKKNAFLTKLIKWGTIPAIIGISYMVLNFLRFDNPFEFGHNYLPEFVNSEDGQFSIKYALENMYKLIRLPEMEGKVMTFPKYNGMNLFIASPIFIVGAFMFAKAIMKRDKVSIVALVCLLAELFCIVCHKTMGGWHFGNRYTIDVLPFAIYAIAAHCKSNNPIYPALALIGFGLNFAWMNGFYIR